MSKVHSTPSIKIPNKAALKELAKNLKLKGAQVTALDDAIHTAEWDERIYRAKHLPAENRQRMVKSLRATSLQLGKLLFTMQKAGPDLDQLLPLASQDLIAGALTTSAKQKLLVPALGLSGTLPSHGWESLALSHPGTLLKSFLEQVQVPLKAWIVTDQLNKGGRPADLPRTLLVRSLAEACPEILGREAPIATGGPFVRLCAEVLVTCELNDIGIEKLVPKVVRRLRKQYQPVVAKKPK